MSSPISFQDLMDMTYSGVYAQVFLGGSGVKFNGDLGKKPYMYGGSISKEYARDFSPNDQLAKADDPYLTTKTNYFNPVYGETVVNWLNFEADIWRLLPKDTYLAKGGSVRTIETEASNFYGQLETATDLGDTDIPDLRELDYTDPAVMYNPWNASLLANLKHQWEDTPGKTSEAFFKDYFARQHMKNINERLCFDTGTLARLGGNFDNFIESIDRVCSDSAEEALLDPGDCDIHGLDRSANEGEAYNDLNGGVLRNLTLDLLDDMVASTKLFSERNNFIFLTDETQLNTIEALEGVHHRYVNDSKWKIDAQQGVNTRKGVKAGFAISTYVAAGVEIPIFTSQHTHAEAGGNGNIYCLDLDHIAIRNALPTVYYTTENMHFLILQKFQKLSMFLTVAQLVADKYNCHGAVKYLN